MNDFPSLNKVGHFNDVSHIKVVSNQAIIPRIVDGIIAR